ncbi:MAG: hypothetical protein ACLGGW_10910, partial [Gammaproteobacteria bacterium]
SEIPPFYRKLQGLKPYRLQMPVGDDEFGPLLAPDGWVRNGSNLKQHKIEEESILAVHLGGERCRLAENLIEPFCLSRLRWGDEFMANESVAGVLVLTSVCYPAVYRHYTFIGGAIDLDSSLTSRIHDHGGGWSRAAGIVTISIPSEKASDFNEFSDLSFLCGGVEFKGISGQ